jgi:predicted ATPase
MNVLTSSLASLQLMICNGHRFVFLIPEADKKSMELNFLADLASDHWVKTRSFVIIGAYRDSEIGEGHILNVALESMKRNSVNVYTIDVLPFTLQEMKELLWEIMAGKDDVVPHVSALAKFLFERSQGSLFFYSEVRPLYSLTSAPAISLRKGLCAL